MAHELDMSNGRANMAYAVGSATPWHGLGFTVEVDSSIEEWQVAGGLNFKVVKGGLMFRDESGVIHEAGSKLNRSVLYRDDTFQPLSVMSQNRYKIHQPDHILQGIDNISKAMNWPVETVGSLFGGRKIWALLKLPEAFALPGGDMIEGYLLICTSFDGSTGTECIFVSVRTVCNNTLQMGIGSAKGPRAVVYHSEEFDIELVKKDLGIGSSVWSNFIETAKRLAEIKLSKVQAKAILRSVYGETDDTKEVDVETYFGLNHTANRALGYFGGAGIGSDLFSSKNTGWGLVNAVTQEVDHFGSNRNARLNSAWFGPGAARKQAVVDAVLAA